MALLGAVLLTILKILGWVLLAVLVLLLIVLLLPIGVAPCYTQGAFTVTLRVLFLRFALWPRHEKKAESSPQKSKKPKKKKPEAKEAPKAAPPPAAASEPAKPAEAPPKAEPPKAENKPKAEPPDAPKPWAKLPFGIPARIDAAIALAKTDPLALAQCALGHLSLFGRGLLHCLHVRHLDVWWSITAQEAADTAIQYGTAMATLNELMAFLYTKLDLKADKLWLEPDFTGERRAERHAGCEIRTNLLSLLWLVLRTLLRLYREPLFKPQKAAQK